MVIVGLPQRGSGFPFFTPTDPEERKQLGMEGVCYRNKEDGGRERGSHFFCSVLFVLVKIKLRIICLFIFFLDPAPGYPHAYK